MNDNEYADSIVAHWGDPPPNKSELRSIIIAALIHARKPFPFAAHEAPTSGMDRYLGSIGPLDPGPNYGFPIKGFKR